MPNDDTTTTTGSTGALPEPPRSYLGAGAGGVIIVLILALLGYVAYALTTGNTNEPLGSVNGGPGAPPVAGVALASHNTHASYRVVLRSPGSNRTISRSIRLASATKAVRPELSQLGPQATTPPYLIPNLCRSFNSSTGKLGGCGYQKNGTIVQSHSVKKLYLALFWNRLKGVKKVGAQFFSGKKAAADPADASTHGKASGGVVAAVYKGPFPKTTFYLFDRLNGKYVANKKGTGPTFGPYIVKFT
jgi:hypothetical protein